MNRCDVGAGTPIGLPGRRLGAMVSSSSLLHVVRRYRKSRCGLSQQRWVIFHRKGAARTRVDRPKKIGRHFRAVDAPREHPLTPSVPRSGTTGPRRTLGASNGIVRALPFWNWTFGKTWEIPRQSFVARGSWLATPPISKSCARDGFVAGDPDILANACLFV
jgi:hypothetical protein